MSAATVAKAERIRQLLGPSLLAAAQGYIRRNAAEPALLDAYLDGLLTVLDPYFVPGAADVEDAGDVEPEAAPVDDVEAPAAPPVAAGEVGRGTPLADVEAWLRSRLELRPEGERGANGQPWKWTEKHTGFYAFDDGGGELWAFFGRKPDAMTRRLVKEAGFWYVKDRRGWRHTGAGRRKERRARAA